MLIIGPGNRLEARRREVQASTSKYWKGVVLGEFGCAETFWMQLRYRNIEKKVSLFL